jgi:hypothetical protein
VKLAPRSGFDLELAGRRARTMMLDDAPCPTAPPAADPNKP